MEIGGVLMLLRIINKMMQLKTSNKYNYRYKYFKKGFFNKGQMRKDSIKLGLHRAISTFFQNFNKFAHNNPCKPNFMNRQFNI